MVVSELFNLLQSPVLDLSANKLESLPEALSQLSDLHTLDVSDNCLSVFPAAIVSDLPKLRVLNLQNNQITGKIMTTFFQLTWLLCFVLDEKII